MPLRFTIHARSRSTRARVGTVETPHGPFQTPAFMTVGTRGTVKGILPQQLRQVGAEVVLNNTYHLLLRPGPEAVRRRGGAHAFMRWNGPILTDSGGYQAYSMADINAVDDDGVSFKSIINGSTIRLTPEAAIQAQNDIGADIIMAFDDCPPSVDPASAPVNQARLRHAAARDARARLAGALGGDARLAPDASRPPRGRAGYDHEARLDLALDRTARWLERCKRAHRRPDEQALFGIVQGGTDLARRNRSAEQVTNVDLPGYAIGGVAVGEQSAEIAAVVRHTAPLLPDDRPRYLMGVGYERDIAAAVCAGVDMFDCVLPTRNGRNAYAFTRHGPIKLRNARFAEEDAPIDPACDCPACAPHLHDPAHPPGAPFTRAYLRHLFMAEEMLGPILVSLHNLRHFQRLMLDIRRAIRDDDWLAFAREWPVAVPGLPEGLIGGNLTESRSISA